MEYELRNEPAYTTGRAHLDTGETVTLEAGALIAHSEGIEMETHSSAGGVLSSIKQSMLADEESFRNSFTATATDQYVEFAQNQPGDLAAIDLDHDSYFVQSGSYVANGEGIETDTASGGMSSWLGGKGLFFLEATGSGTLFVGSYGGIVERELDRDERLTVDTGHSVAWHADVSFSTHKVGGLKSTLLGGEGFVMTFEGPGSVYLQTRDYSSFIADVISNVDTD
ncbi:TIGR00266 family protein [Halorubrum luteum]